MPACCSYIHRFFRKMDLFPTSNLLRYNGEAQYTTFTGGFISFAVIAIFIGLFFSMGVRTIKRQIITASIDNQYETDPSELNFKVGPGYGDMMFLIHINHVNLSATPRLFDVYVTQDFYTSGYVLVNSTDIPLEPCTGKHVNYTDKVRSTITSFPEGVSLCPQVGQQFTVKGKYASPVFAQIRINVDRCNTTDPTCASDAVFNSYIDALGEFQMNIPYVGTMINPGNQQYRSYYVEDIDYIMFDANFGSYASGMIRQDRINTDQSIMPWEDIQTQNITRITQKYSTSRFVTNGSPWLVEAVFLKSPSTSTFNRSFNKVDAYFSYVGGLVGTIIGIFFIMGPYTEKAYEVSLARKILRGNDHTELSSKSFNLGYFFLSVIKEGFSAFSIDVNWPKTQKYIDFCEEMGNQVDITFIVRKLMFLDAAVRSMLEDHEIQALCTRAKPTLEEAKQQRKHIFAPQMFKVQRDEQQQDKNECDKFDDTKNLSSQKISFVEGERLQNADQNEQTSKQASQDFSAIEFSEIGDDVKHIRKAVRKVQSQRKRGNIVSERIMNKVDSKILKQMKRGHEEDEKDSPEKIHVKSKSKDGSDEKEEKKGAPGGEFDFNFEQ